MVGITGEIEEVPRQRKIKSEAWIVDAFYHEGLTAEDDLCRLILQGRLKPVTHVVEGFDKLPEAIVELYRAGRSGKRRFSSERCNRIKTRLR
jgi:NADPH-dependent curcumin reductase CurA